MKRNICEVHGCRSYIMAKGLCAYHYGGYLLTVQKKRDANVKTGKPSRLGQHRIVV